MRELAKEVSKESHLGRVDSSCKDLKHEWYCYVPGAAVAPGSELVAQDEIEAEAR